MAQNATARKQLQRERERLAQLDAGKPWKGLIGEEREPAIRDHYGYAPSEKRTQAERQQAAGRMVANSRASLVAMGTSEEEIRATWQRQADELEGERQRKRAELNRDQPGKFPPDQELRARRAAAYRAWDEAGRPSGAGWEEIKRQHGLA